MYSCTDLAPLKKSFYLFIRIGGRAGGMIRGRAGDGAGGGAEGGAYLRVRAAVGDAGYGAGIGVATRAGGVLPVYDHVRVQVVTAILVDGTPMTHVLRRRRGHGSGDRRPQTQTSASQSWSVEQLFLLQIIIFQFGYFLEYVVKIV